MGRVYNTSDFIEKSLKVHNGFYSYEKSVYHNNRERLTITCPIHGDFTMTPEKHLRGDLCSNCSKEVKFEKLRIQWEMKFFEDAKKLHGDRYLLHEVEYKTAKTPVKIICRQHGMFEQMPTKFLLGQGCTKCANVSRGRKQRLDPKKTREKCIKKHEGRYEYKNVFGCKKYRKHDKISIKCDIHGWFEQILELHIKGHGCPKCAQIRSVSDLMGDDMNLPCIFYYVEFLDKRNGNVFHKVGVTRQQLEKRFNKTKYPDFEVTPIHIINSTLGHCMSVEDRVMEYLQSKDLRYTLVTLKNDFAGWTECFSSNVVIPETLYKRQETCDLTE